MNITAGTKLGRYEVRSKLGAGGMGEVYLARDTQLDRMAALKILSAEVARDQQRLIRFLQEARAASALSHPNVAHIYEIGEADGVHFIAMEFVEGQGLDKRISGGPLGVTELLDIGIQIADALDEAHAKGITHRDIKSSNIMITPRGQVKVLDFGLAKLSLPPGASDRTSDSEVATRVKTSPGVVMGTVNYMSPEQAMGREVDHRSDIFSFGVVLYEMATGRLPFTGDTITETIDRITHSQPEAIARLNYDVPSELETIVKKALRKNREERYQTVHDLLVDLKDVKRELDLAAGLERSMPPPQKSAEVSTSTLVQPIAPAASVSRPPETSLIPAAQPTSSAEYVISEIKRHKMGALAVAAIALLVVAVVGVGVYKFVTSKNQTTTKPAGPGVSPNMKITRLTTSGNALEAAISPDGRWVVYVQKDGGQQSLWIRQIVTNSIIQIVPPADVRIGRETFSPDGNYVYYFIFGPNDPGVLYQAPTIGGPPRKILTNLESPITFSPDTRHIAFTRNDEVATGEDQLIVANVDGTGERKLAVRKGDKWFLRGGCGWSPDGKVIACAGGKYKGGLDNFVIAVDPETGEQKELTSAEFSDMGRVSWLADGSGVVVNAADRASYFSQLWFISYPGGEAHKITNDLNEYHGTSFTSESKSLVTVQYDTTANIWIAPSGDMAHAKQITSGKFEGGGGLAWTPDGRIVHTSFDSGNPDIWIMKSDGTGRKQLTTDPASDRNPAASPDGHYIVFVSSRRGLPSLWRMDLDGGNLKQLTDQEDYLPHISPDSQWIVFDSWRSGRRTLWKVSIDGGQPVQVTDKFTSSSGISPDGKLIACFYRDEQAGASWRIMILPFDGGPPVKTFDTPSTAADDDALNAAIAWTPDGRGIAYIDSLGGTPNLWSQALDGGPPKKLTDFKENGVRPFAWSRDGKQLALVRGTVTSDVVLIRDFR